MKIKKKYLAYLLRQKSWGKRLKIVEWMLRNKGLKGPFPMYAKIEIDQRCNLKCFTEDTLILMADFSWKKISEVQLDEELIGVIKPDEKHKHYEFVSSKVTHVFEPEISDVVEVVFEDGTKIETTPTHEFLSKHGRWRHAINMTNEDPPKWTLKPEQYEETYGYIKGYLSGAWLSDGLLWQKKYADGWRHKARFAVKDLEFLNVVDAYLKVYDIELSRRPFSHPTIKECIIASNKSTKERIEDLIEVPATIDGGWARGFLGGFFDGDGSYDGNTIRFCNTNKDLIDVLICCLEKLNFDYSISGEQPDYPGSKYRYDIRLKGGRTEDWRFFIETKSKITRKRKITGSTSGTMNVESINSVGKKMVYNLETGCSNYIANGAIVHNCPKCFRDEVVNNKFLTINQFEEIIEKLEPGIQEVWTHGFGESTINPEFIEMMRILYRRNILWGLATNGATKFFEERRNLVHMLELQPTKIRFSVDAATPEIFEKERFPAKAGTVMQNIRNTVEVRDYLWPERNKTQPRVDLYCVLTMQTLDQIGPMIALRDRLGCDYLTFSDLAFGNEYGTSKESNCIRQMMTNDEIESLIAPYKNIPRVNFNIPRPDKRTCDYPKIHIYVSSEGNVWPCTCTPGFTEPIGSIWDVSDIKELYQSDKWNEFREKSKYGLFDSSVCRKCLQWGSDYSDI